MADGVIVDTGTDSIENKSVKQKLFGRKVLYTDTLDITRENIVEVIREVEQYNVLNISDMNRLHDMYVGKQEIMHRTKDIRPEICNKIVNNKAYEIVTFKTGYLLGEPVQFIPRGSERTKEKEINYLNSLLHESDKEAQDNELGTHMHIYGTSYRMVLPVEDDDKVFKTYVLDPRSTFVIYSNDVDKEPIIGGTIIVDKNNQSHYSIYTKDKFYKIKNFSSVSNNTEEIEESPNALGIVPIIEYPLNQDRIGSFEVVQSLLDALNLLDSNRLDGVEQAIQYLIKFINTDIDEETFKSLKDLGAIKVKSPQGVNADVEILTNELNQQQVETLKSSILLDIDTICALPNRNGNGNSTSDTGSAVIMRDGWQSADSVAKSTELIFKTSEKKFIKIVSKILSEKTDHKLKVMDVDIKFTRRNYENILTKAQVLVNMLGNPKIHPKLAFIHCGMFSDPDTAYNESLEYYEANKETVVSEDTKTQEKIVNEVE